VAELVPGAYEQLVTARFSQALAAIDPELTEREALDPADAHVVLARHLGALAQRALRSVGGSDEHARLVRQVELANAVAEAYLDDQRSHLLDSHERCQCQINHAIRNQDKHSRDHRILWMQPQLHSPARERPGPAPDRQRSPTRAGER